MNRKAPALMIALIVIWALALALGQLSGCSAGGSSTTSTGTLRMSIR